MKTKKPTYRKLAAKVLNLEEALKEARAKERETLFVIEGLRGQALGVPDLRAAVREAQLEERKLHDANLFLNREVSRLRGYIERVHDLDNMHHPDTAARATHRIQITPEGNGVAHLGGPMAATDGCENRRRS